MDQVLYIKIFFFYCFHVCLFYFYYSTESKVPIIKISSLHLGNIKLTCLCLNNWFTLIFTITIIMYKTWCTMSMNVHSLTLLYNLLKVKYWFHSLVFLIKENAQKMANNLTLKIYREIMKIYFLIYLFMLPCISL